MVRKAGADGGAAKKPARGRKKKQVEPASRGLTAAQVARGSPPAALQKLSDSIEQDGGSVLATFPDPLGGLWQILAALPVARAGTESATTGTTGSMVGRRLRRR